MDSICAVAHVNYFVAGDTTLPREVCFSSVLNNTTLQVTVDLRRIQFSDEDRVVNEFCWKRCGLQPHSGPGESRHCYDVFDSTGAIRCLYRKMRRENFKYVGVVGDDQLEFFKSLDIPCVDLRRWIHVPGYPTLFERNEKEGILPPPIHREVHRRGYDEACSTWRAWTLARHFRKEYTLWRNN